MDVTEIPMHFVFGSKNKAEEFLKKLLQMSHSVGWVTVNDILREQTVPVIVGGGDYGYSRKDLKKVKPQKINPQKDGSWWHVIFSTPGKLVRDSNGYWTVEDIPKEE